MQSRFPTKAHGGNRSAAPYGVFEGFADLFEDFHALACAARWMPGSTAIFSRRDRVQFADGEAVFKGGLSDSATLRDYNPRSFLTNLIWNTRGETPMLPVRPGRRAGYRRPSWPVIPNAKVLVISGAFAVPLWRSGRPVAEVRAEAARLQKVEADLLALLELPETKARVRVWTLAEFVENPVEPLQTARRRAEPARAHRATELPRLVAAAGLWQHSCRTCAIRACNPVLMGDFPRPSTWLA